ncbi:hypothetical protein EJF36_14760 [Bacillus sp. HMF5848]|uniref:hypothetical protein n=1 Tax=Bacillus sp. HMF5848 TaxID=2495421 RepID=UPI000F7B630C|nr:hypothetical protein [Bacillus sp. HMF5848]RSK28037.1 hypothetical protein EJF36_14760 [Bacillus sp. HMF5848]
MKRRFSLYGWPPWRLHIRPFIFSCIIPLTVFQGIRTLILPTSFDVVLLGLLILLACSLYLDWI